MEFPIALPGITLFSDGSFLRTPSPQPPVPPDPSFVHGVASKDLSSISDSGVCIRVYLPEFSVNSSKLPVLVYFHGGGFVLGSVADPMFDEICRKLAKGAHVMVISVEYSLAPEHRLPAAFDECFDALKWLQKQAAMGDAQTVEPWLRLYADFSACFLMGHSAGASIVHHVALRAVQGDIAPLKLCGLILAVPFFGGNERTGSEMSLAEGGVLTLKMCDAFWFHSLPEGASRDHPFCWVVSPEAPKLSGEKVPPVLVIIGELDLLRDRQIEYVRHLRNAGVSVTLAEIKNADHGILLGKEADKEFQQTLQFIQQCKPKP